MVTIKLTGQFMQLAPQGSEKGVFTIDFNPGLELSELLDRLGIKAQNLKFTALVNNARKPEDYVLEDSDLITIMPLLAGG
jgi:sulfur carrier protein ThiS